MKEIKKIIRKIFKIFSNGILGIILVFGLILVGSYVFGIFGGEEKNGGFMSNEDFKENSGEEKKINLKENTFKKEKFLEISIFDRTGISGKILSNKNEILEIEVLSCDGNKSKKYDDFWYKINKYKKGNEKFEYKISDKLNNNCDIPYYIRFKNTFGKVIKIIKLEFGKNKKTYFSDYKKISDNFYYLNKNIYYKGKALYTIDYKTFHILDDYYFQDKNGIYCLGNYYYNFSKINIEDKKTFHTLKYGYAKNNKNIYYTFFSDRSFTVKSNYETFKILGKNYTKDKNGIYFNSIGYKGKLISKDLENFEILDDHFAKDSKNIFINGFKRDGDAKTFKLLKNGYARDKNRVFYFTDENPKVVDEVGENFKVLKYSFAKDSNHMFWNGIKIYNFLNNDEEKIYDEHFISDGFYLYYNGEREFKIKNEKQVEDYIKKINKKKVDKIKFDKNSLGFEIYKKYGDIKYLYNQLDDFIYYSSSKDDKIKLNIKLEDVSYISKNYILGKNNGYYKGKVINGIDVKSFKILGDGYAKDKNFVYKDGIKQIGLDAKTFFNISCGFIYSNGKFYYHGKKADKFNEIEKKFNFEDIKFYKTTKYGFDGEGKNCILGDEKNLLYFKRFKLTKDDEINSFFGGNSEKPEIVLQEGFDYKTFKEIGRGYQKDKNNVYYEYEILKYADVNSFEILKNSEDFDSRDKKYFYYHGNIKTLEKKKKIIQKKSNFNESNTKKEIDKTKLIKLKYYYYKDEKYIYTDSYRDGLKEVDFGRNNPDIKTFEILDDNFAKDKNNVYQKVDPCDHNGNEYGDFISLGANPKTFKIECIFGKDDEKTYNEYVDIVDNIDIKTFEFKNGFYRDKNYIYDYYREFGTQECTRNLGGTGFNKEKLNIVQGADYKTYKKVKDFSYGSRGQRVRTSLYKDKNFYYLNGEKIKGTNSKEKLLDLGLGYYFNNGNIYHLSFENKIIGTNFDKKNLRKIIVTDEFICGPGEIDAKTIFFSEKEYLKYKKKFSCDY